MLIVVRLSISCLFQNNEWFRLFTGLEFANKDENVL